MKLELKHIAPYLPYNLMLYDERQENKIDKMIGLFQDTIDFEYWSPIDFGRIENYKPILRPLSDLYKEIDGVVHIVELAKIADPNVNWTFKDSCYFPVDSNRRLFVFGKQNCFAIEYNKEIGRGYVFVDQFALFNYLFEHHFDVYGLIKAGLAIDVNTTN